jgi:3-methyladenine DNA glycosylase AlkC
VLQSCPPLPVCGEFPSSQGATIDRNTPLKYGYTDAYIARIAASVNRSWPGFDRAAFTALILASNWDELELKDRMRCISRALDETLPSDFSEALATLDPVLHEFSGFLAMFFPHFLERRIARDFEANWELGVLALARFTVHSSSEFAVRPLILQNPARMLGQMLDWTSSDCEHVRRLASEGSRPRLPWAMALPALKHDPTPLLPILEALRDDPSEYVRRSVANSWNDISKDHPGIVLEMAERWLEETPSISSTGDRRRLVKHACRTLLKAGSPLAMVLFGFRDPKALHAEAFRLERPTIRLGDSLEFTFRIASKSSIGRVRIEYAVFYQKANGSMSPKVFKISELDCVGKQRTVTRRHKFRDLSTRKHHAGPHAIELRLNGVPKAKLGFELRL